VASYSNNHDIAMVHDVGAKLRLNRVNCTINVSKDMWSIFSQVEPFWVQRDPIWVDLGALTGTPSFSVKEAVYLTCESS
jgi:hypothetical protein